MKLVVIGIGQRLRGDDAVGVEVVRRWEKQHPETAAHPEVHVEISELPGLQLLDLLAGAQAGILVDAVLSNATPGTLHHLTQDDLASFAEGAGSAHGWGVAETLALAETLGQDDLPAALVILGIEVGQSELGKGVSPAVQAAIPSAIQVLQDVVSTHLRA